MNRLTLFLLAAAAFSVLVGAGIYGAGRQKSMDAAYQICAPQVEAKTNRP